jgi:hypothetical protein
MTAYCVRHRAFCAWTTCGRGRILVSCSFLVRRRLFVSNIIRRLLPDHVFKAYLSSELHSICDESVCGHLFLDLKGFTEMSKMLTPEESFTFLSSLFGAFDEICAKWEVMKIETIGAFSRFRLPAFQIAPLLLPWPKKWPGSHPLASCCLGRGRVLVCCGHAWQCQQL